MLCSHATAKFEFNTHPIEIIRHFPSPTQDNISHLKLKMAANARENDEKMSTIKEASELILTKKCFSNARNESCFSDGFTAGSGSRASPLS